MPSVIFNSTINKTASGQIDFSADAFKVMLLTDNYRPDKKRHSTRADIAETEAMGPGYEVGGNFVPVKINNDVASNRVDILLGGSEWGNSTVRARGAAYYKVQNDELVAYIDFGREVASTNGLFQLTPSTLRIQN